MNQAFSRAPATPFQVSPLDPHIGAQKMAASISKWARTHFAL
jgi:hypothetical protein